MTLTGRENLTRAEKPRAKKKAEQMTTPAWNSRPI
ncbi:hypothetical protein CCACVL1_10196 [Corchorus capsularis]|uniref:Uncharacterized protein n=1 Tax=Corchorus capsularis TaxID=210143 RepID=A0A1R3IS54_COCAP|nr:hypothetical protein CCACVL1_10196 [Corchorus capsularis]